jgi:hypothetical protein
MLKLVWCQLDARRSSAHPIQAKLTYRNKNQQKVGKQILSNRIVTRLDGFLSNFVPFMRHEKVTQNHS